jgi:predicted GTPase
MGYTAAQLEALRATIAAVPADAVVAATPIDLAALIPIEKPVLRARYEYAEVEEPGLAGELERFLKRIELA